MKNAILFTVFVIALGFSACNNNESTVTAVDTTKLNSGETFYQCPMDKEVISAKEGSCPKCGMDLEKVEKK